MFFFASRRRHTRWPRDWSSDVYSSDLTASSAPSAEQRVPAEGTTGSVTVTDDSVILGDPDAPERVHIYQDLNCPHCQVLHGLMAEDVANWAQGDSVAVEVTVVDYLEIGRASCRAGGSGGGVAQG